MKNRLSCFPCFVSQALKTARASTRDPQMHLAVVREVLKKGAEFSMNLTPPHMGKIIYGIIKEITGVADPYKDDKRKFNEASLALVPKLEGIVSSADDPLEKALLISIAGNIIDFGAPGNIEPEDLLALVEDTIEKGFFVGNPEKFRHAVKMASRILFVGDNAGEVVFDRVLLERLPMEKIIYVVRGGPIINDATRGDAEIAGITSLCKVIDTGAEVPGVILEFCSEEFKKHFEEADLLITKGQGNYETLSENAKPIIFLLKAKCPVIAEDIGCLVGDTVMKFQHC